MSKEPDQKKALAKPQDGPEKLPFLPPEIASQIPTEVQVQLTSFMAQGAMGNPIANKITSEHISRALDLAGDTADKNFNYAKGTRWFQFGVFVIAVAGAMPFLVDFPSGAM